MYFQPVVPSSPTSGAIPVIMATRIHLFPFRTQKLSSSTAKVLGRIASCRISKKRNRNESCGCVFFATCYPTREGEQGVFKIADTRYFALRGEPTTKYSGWRCPSRHVFTLMAARKQVAGFQSKMTVFKPKTVIFFCFDLFFDRSSMSKNLNLSQVLLLISVY